MSEESSGPTEPGSILIVCTGNICRSPYLERRLRQLVGGYGYRITSAGTRAMVGYPIEPGSATRLQGAGADVADFAARLLTAELVAESDLILTATRAHRSEVVRLEPAALRRTYALGDFSDHLAAAELGDPEPGESRVAHLARVVSSGRAAVQPRSTEEVDIVDPYGRPDHVYAEMAGQIERAIGPLIVALVD